MTEFNKEVFVEEYVKALKESDMEAIGTLIAGLTVEDKQAALDGVIEAIEADKELAEKAADTLGVLKDIKEKNLIAEAEALRQAETNVGAEPEVAAPSIKQEEA